MVLYPILSFVFIRGATDKGTDGTTTIGGLAAVVDHLRKPKKCGKTKGEIMGKSCEYHGNIMGTSREHHGNITITGIATCVFHV